MKYFGTDGIRGVAFVNLTHKICFGCGNALTKLIKRPIVVIGRDSRTSGEFFSLSTALGIMLGGGKVVDVGIIPTAGVSHLVTSLNADFGVVISASHNAPNYNGIKILNKFGTKIDQNQESFIEENLNNLFIEENEIGKLYTKHTLKKFYIDFLIKSSWMNLFNCKIVLDCCYGASCDVAPKVFKKLGAKVITLHKVKDGKKINVGCGATNTKILSKAVVKYKADFGLAFDGDSDRLIAVDENGKEVSGDKIIYIFAKYLHKKNKLKNNLVVGTLLTNLGIEQQLKKYGINLIRSDVGDKNVANLMDKEGAILGGEDAGHIIIKDFLPTGDGILSGIILSCICKESKLPLSQLAQVELCPQVVANIKTPQKDKIISDKKLLILLKKLEKTYPNCMILVRKSGTEDVVRIMCQSNCQKQATQIVSEVAKLIEQLKNQYE